MTDIVEDIDLFLLELSNLSNKAFDKKSYKEKITELESWKNFSNLRLSLEPIVSSYYIPFDSNFFELTTKSFEIENEELIISTSKLREKICKATQNN